VEQINDIVVDKFDPAVVELDHGCFDRVKGLVDLAAVLIDLIVVVS
jgi:hypothetical protein